MRNYKHIDLYLDRLKTQIYPQPDDVGHTDFAQHAIDELLPEISYDVGSVLDVGCGTGFCERMFTNRGIDWVGVTLGRDDLATGKSLERNIFLQDVSFLDFPDGSFDLIFARHILEHSPLPLLTLMEWERVSKKYLIVILPAPEYWGTCGQNHYYVLNKPNWECLFSNSGWNIIKQTNFTFFDPIWLKHWNPDTKKKPREEQLKERGDIVIEYRYILEKQ